jgi:hypothetical protein
MGADAGISGPGLGGKAKASHVQASHPDPLVHSTFSSFRQGRPTSNMPVEAQLIRKYWI